MTKQSTRYQIEARKRNWFIFQFRGLEAQVHGFSNKRQIAENRQAVRAMHEALTKIREAMTALDICHHEVDHELMYHAGVFECVHCKRELYRSKRKRK